MDSRRGCGRQTAVAVAQDFVTKTLRRIPAEETVRTALDIAAADNEGAENKSEGNTEIRKVDGVKARWIYSKSRGVRWFRVLLSR